LGEIRKVVYLVEAPFNKRDYERFGVGLMQDSGFAVEVWDFTQFLAAPEYRGVRPPDPISWAGLRVFRDEVSALSALEGLDRTAFAVNLLTYNGGSLAVHRALERRGVRYCVQAVSIPGWGSETMSWRNRLRTLTWGRIWKKLTRRPRPDGAPVRPADLVLGSGESYYTSGAHVGPDSETLWSHSLDYDIYLRERGAAGEPQPRTGVFLDEYFPLHPDNLHYGLAATLTPEEYYPMLCRFFGALERRFGVRIVIAAHPRSHYEDHPDFFEGRTVVRGRTAQLVRDCGFALMHHSLAGNFAVLFRKPILFLTSKRLDAYLTEDPSVEWLAAFLGKKPHYMDRPFAVDWEREMRIDEEAYRAYRNAYIKKDGSPDLPSWRILADRLKRC
jgi:hypothetical protein